MRSDETGQYLTIAGCRPRPSLPYNQDRAGRLDKQTDTESEEGFILDGAVGQSQIDRIL